MELYIREWRKAKGLSQERLAMDSGISRQALIFIEKKRSLKPHPRTLEALARTLGCSVYALTEKPPVQEQEG